MKLVTYNIQYGKGQDDVVDLKRIAGEVSGADVIALQEVERYWPRSDNIDQVQFIADQLNDYFWVYGAGVDLHVEDSNPADNQRRQFGNMLLTRNPILASRHHLLPKYGSTDALSIQRSAIEATVQCGQRLLRLYSIHLTHLASATRLPQLEKLLDIHENAVFEGAAICGNLVGMGWDCNAPPQEVPAEAIFMGDFNFQPDSAEYELMVGPPSDYGGRIANPAGFVDAWCTAGNDIDEGATSDVHGEPARLDYCFLSNSLKDRVISCRIDDKASGSDHFPVWIELDL